MQNECLPSLWMNPQTTQCFHAFYHICKHFKPVCEWFVCVRVCINWWWLGLMLLCVKQWHFFHYSNLMFSECLPLSVLPGLSPVLCPHCCTYETDRDSLCQPPCLEPCQTPPCLAPPLCWCLWVCNNGEHIAHSLTGTITHARAKSLTRT